MSSRTPAVAVLAAVLLAAGPVSRAQEAAPTAPANPAAPSRVDLPAPATSGGHPLRDALRERRSSREFAARELPAQLLSDLLWAANGINRPGLGKRTAPSARNWQEIDVYVILPAAAYRYDAQANALAPVASGDLRGAAGGQPFVATAPVNLVYVADTARMEGASPGQLDLYSGADAAFVAQNVYLFCASEGLATVVRASLDREALARALGLRPEQRIVLAQTVGFPQ